MVFSGRERLALLYCLIFLVFVFLFDLVLYCLLCIYIIKKKLKYLGQFPLCLIKFQKGEV